MRKTDFTPYHEPTNKEVLAAVIFQVLIIGLVAGIIILAYLMN